MDQNYKKPDSRGKKAGIRVSKVWIVAILAMVACIAILFIWAQLTMRWYAPKEDIQQGLTLEGNHSTLIFNVTIVNQSNSDALSTIYLLNALTNKGYWYQAGVAYNWSG